MAILDTQHMPPWHGKNEGPNGVVSGKIRHCIAVGAFVRNQVACKSMFPKIRAPHAVRIGHVSQAKPFQCKASIGFIPTLP